jgi:hypothetical protein
MYSLITRHVKQRNIYGCHISQESGGQVETGTFGQTPILSWTKIWLVRAHVVVRILIRDTTTDAQGGCGANFFFFGSCDDREINTSLLSKQQLQSLISNKVRFYISSSHLLL